MVDAGSAAVSFETSRHVRPQASTKDNSPSTLSASARFDSRVLLSFARLAAFVALGRNTQVQLSTTTTYSFHDQHVLRSLATHVGKHSLSQLITGPSNLDDG
nr:hypothetical protein CFP56_42255 [Quercus suber]